MKRGALFMFLGRKITKKQEKARLRTQKMYGKGLQFINNA